MRVLFYIEPLPEKRPLWKQAWLNFVARFVDALRSDDPREDEFALVVSDALAPIAASRFPDVRIVEIQAGELLPAFGASALEAAAKWYRDDAGPVLTQRMADLLAARLAGFEADVCITLSPAPFLKTLFPKAAVLNFEYGMLSRAPFPETGFLDPIGIYNAGVLGKLREQLRIFRAKPRELETLERIRDIYTAKMQGRNNPLHDIVPPLLKGKRAAILVALQFSDFYCYDCHAAFPQQGDFLRHVLDATPSDVAVIACEHPEHPLFDDATLAFYRQRFPNLVWAPEFRAVYASGQYLIEYADAVVTVSSSVGLQAPLWKKKLIVLGASHLDIFADGHAMAELDRVLAAPWDTARDHALAWLLTRYYQPFDLLFDPTRLRNALERAVETQMQTPALSWFKSQARPERLVSSYQQAANRLFAASRAPTPTMGIFNANLYSATDVSDFGEPTCARATFHVTDEPTSYEIQTPRYDQPIRRMQLRLGDRVGRMGIHRIEVGLSGEAPVWSWPGGVGGLYPTSGLMITNLPERQCAMAEILNPEAGLDIALPPDVVVHQAIVRVVLSNITDAEFSRLRRVMLERALGVEDLRSVIETVASGQRTQAAETNQSRSQISGEIQRLAELVANAMAVSGQTSSAVQRMSAEQWPALLQRVEAGFDASARTMRSIDERSIADGQRIDALGAGLQDRFDHTMREVWDLKERLLSVIAGLPKPATDDQIRNGFDEMQRKVADLDSRLQASLAGLSSFASNGQIREAFEEMQRMSAEQWPALLQRVEAGFDASARTMRSIDERSIADGQRIDALGAGLQDRFDHTMREVWDLKERLLSVIAGLPKPATDDQIRNGFDEMQRKVADLDSRLQASLAGLSSFASNGQIREAFEEMQRKIADIEERLRAAIANLPPPAKDTEVRAGFSEVVRKVADIEDRLQMAISSLSAQIPEWEIRTAGVHTERVAEDLSRRLQNELKRGIEVAVQKIERHLELVVSARMEHAHRDSVSAIRSWLNNFVAGFGDGHGPLPQAQPIGAPSVASPTDGESEAAGLLVSASSRGGNGGRAAMEMSASSQFSPLSRSALTQDVAVVPGGVQGLHGERSLKSIERLRRDATEHVHRFLELSLETRIVLGRSNTASRDELELWVTIGRRVMSELSDCAFVWLADVKDDAHEFLAELLDASGCAERFYFPGASLAAREACAASDIVVFTGGARLNVSWAIQALEAGCLPIASEDVGDAADLLRPYDLTVLRQGGTEAARLIVSYLTDARLRNQIVQTLIDRISN